MDKFVVEYAREFLSGDPFHSLWLMPDVGDNTPRFLSVELHNSYPDGYEFLPFRLRRGENLSSDAGYYAVVVTPNEFAALLDGRMEPLPTFDVFHMTLLKTGPLYKPHEPNLHYDI